MALSFFFYTIHLETKSDHRVTYLEKTDSTVKELIARMTYPPASPTQPITKEHNKQCKEGGNGPISKENVTW